MFSSGEGYEGLMGRHSMKLAPLFADFIKVRDVGAMLDVGCGTGSMARVLAERTREARVVGVDPSTDFVEFARKRFSGNARVNVHEANALELPFQNQSFDLTVSLLVLMFIQDMEKALGEQKRVTRPRGTVAACVWDGYGMKMNTLFREEAAKLDPAFTGGERVAHYFKPGELARLWKRLGFGDVAEASFEIQMEFRSFDEHWTSQLTGGGPMSGYLAGLSDEHQQKLRRAIRKRHLGDRPAGPYSLPAKALAVRGTVTG